MIQDGKKFSLLLIAIISIFFIFLFNLSSIATSYLPGDFCGPMGDPTPDGKVDFNDLMVFATAYGSEVGDPNWNELCDICGYLGDPTPDGKVNFDDLMIFATNYGKEIETIIPETTEIIDEETEQAILSVSEDQSTMVLSYSTPQTDSIEVGDIIIMGVTEQTPYGLLRKVTDIDKGTTKYSPVNIYLGFATLEEAVQKGQWEYSQTLKPEDIEKGYIFPEGIRPVTGKASTTLNFEYEINDILYDQDNNPATTENNITATGYLAFNYQVTFDGDIDGHTLKYFIFENIIETDSELNISVGLSVSIADLANVADVTIGEPIPFTPVTVLIPTPIPLIVIPLVFFPSIELKVGIEGEARIKLDVGITQTTSYTAGIEFTDGDWQNITDPLPNIVNTTKLADPEGTIHVTAHAGPQLNCKLYKVAGPYCNIFGYLYFDADTTSDPWWDLDAGLTVSAGVKMDVLSIHWDSGELPLFDLLPRFDVADAGGPFGGTGPVHNLTKDTYYNTIQAALDDADSDNIIEVSEGTYNENINFNGKNITLRSTNPNDPDVVASTIIDGGGNGSVVIFAGGETRQAVLKGLTIQNGNSEPGSGGGIMINNSSPTISGNIIRWNKTHIDHGGGGIFIAHLASPLIEGNTIDGNQGGFGGGIYVGDNSSPTIRNNTIENNLAEIRRGGGIFISGSSSPTIQDNSLSDNSSQYGGGICIVESSSGEISNNYFTLNAAQYGGGIFCGEDADPIIKQNEFYENSATGFGGGLFIGESSPHLTGNIIESNSSQTGGGIFVWESSPTISDNTINGNTATASGGGINISSDSHPTINNNIISLNNATFYGGGLYIDGSSSVKTTNGNTWPRQNTPPNAEATNTYFDNTHGNPLDYTEGADVYMVGAITPPQIIEPPIEHIEGRAGTYHSTRSRSISRNISNDDSVIALYYSGNLSDALSKGGITNIIDIIWPAYDNCTGYRVYRSKNSSEYSIIFDWDTSGIISNWFGFYDHDVEIGNTYRYYVTAYNDTENWETVQSNIYTIEINNETFLPPIYLDQPQDYGMVDDSNYLFKWTPVGNILPYGDVVEGQTWLRIFDADTLSSLWVKLYSDNFTTSQVTYNGNTLISGNTYRWYVRGYGFDANGQIIASSESEVWEFTYNFNVTPVPDTPTLYDLSYGPLSGTNYELTWSDESSNWAEGYEIQESEYSDFRSICGGESTLSTRATFNHSVTENTSYFYRVRSVNSYNNASGWSNIVEVMVEGSAPPPDAPVLYNLFYNPSSGANYDMTWSNESSSGAAGYEIEESEYSDFSSICGGMSTIDTSCTFGHDVTENTYYYYRVRSMNSEGVYSEEWSNTVEVIVEGIPKASITVVTRDHNSTLISGGISYILYDDSNPWNAICNSGSSSSNSYTFDDLEAGTYNIESYKYNDYSLQGYYAAKVDISLSEGQNNSITIYTSAIAVCLVDSNNNFIPSDGLEYVLYLEDGSGAWRWIKTVTPSSNNYTFINIPSGIYNVEAYTYGNHRGTAVDIYVAPQELVPRIIVAN